jgi:hypothetical protein
MPRKSLMETTKIACFVFRQVQERTVIRENAYKNAAHGKSVEQ